MHLFYNNNDYCLLIIMSVPTYGNVFPTPKFHIELNNNSICHIIHIYLVKLLTENTIAIVLFKEQQ